MSNNNQPSQKTLYIWSLIKSVFDENENGKKLLELLKEEFLMLPVCPPGCQEGFGYYRQGQNDTLLYFERCMNKLDAYNQQVQKSNQEQS